MPTSSDKFPKKAVSTFSINQHHQPNHLENDKLLVKSEDVYSCKQLKTEVIESSKPAEDEFKVEYVWPNIIGFIFMHLCIPYAFIVGAMNGKYYLFFWHVFLGYMAGLGVTAGAHRLWSHQAYKAHWTVRVFLAFWFTLAGQNDIYEWCRDHRVHHKWSETHADPHNSNRGFFFAHMGWLMCRKHPEVIRKGQTLNFDDLLKDPVVRFHRKYYKILMPLVVFLIPTYATVKLFNETWEQAFFQSICRYCISLHITWLVNSAAHLWGYRPYNDKINPRESPFVIYINILGEGFHNYHHSFPYDYRASEFGFHQLNFSCFFITCLSWVGLAWDLRTANEKMIENAKRKVEENERQKELSLDKELLKENEFKAELSLKEKEFKSELSLKEHPN